MKIISYIYKKDTVLDTGYVLAFLEPSSHFAAIYHVY
jgi:hypothetical protein